MMKQLSGEELIAAQESEMKLDLMRNKSSKLELIDDVEKVECLRIWFCKYKTLNELSKFINLKELTIAGFPNENFSMLSNMANLEYLSVLDMPKVNSLNDLVQLKKLKYLSLSTSPSWDGTKKRTVVDTLAPIQEIESLEWLELFGVCSEIRTLDELSSFNKLKAARFNGYSARDTDSFYSRSGVANKLDLSDFECW